MDAAALHARLAEIDVTTVPMTATNRHIPRKDQARLTRQLFKSLGIKGISVTAPRYSMAQGVDLSIPTRQDFLRDDRGDVDFLNSPAAQANRAAEEKIRAILARAFPNHNDRSDSNSDYYDYKWCFHSR